MALVPNLHMTHLEPLQRTVPIIKDEEREVLVVKAGNRLDVYG
jgi:hypothetical protein